MKSMMRVIDENRKELDAHLTRIADILSEAGAQDPIGELHISSKDLSPLGFAWRRD